jgi:hypothetical protein
MNRKFAGLLVVLSFLVIFRSDVFADFESIYMVDGKGSTLKETTFDWDEIPYLYLRLPRSGWSVTVSFWQDPDNLHYFASASPQLEGDANKDGEVNIRDLNILKLSYAKHQGQPGYDPRADFDGTNQVNIKDLNILKRNYAKKSDPDTWLSLDDWDDVKKLGEWNVNAAYFYPNRDSGTGKTDFTVTPEPISTILFCAGGITLVGRYHWKRRKA